MKGERIQVTSTATPVAGHNSSDSRQAGPGSVALPTAALIRVPSGALTVYFGGSQVTTGTGCPVVAGEDISVDLVNEILYAVIESSTTSQVVHVLRRGD